MSKHKKSVGKVKPPWVGKTKSSLLKRIEQALNPNNRGPIQRRITDNRKFTADVYNYRGGRTATARRENAAAAKAHPVDSWVSGRYNEPFVGKVVRVRNGKYTLQLSGGGTLRVPFWLDLKKVEVHNV